MSGSAACADIRYREAALDEELIARLIALSADWEAENSCFGYRKNTPEDIEGNRVFLAQNGDGIVAYLFGHSSEAKNMSSILPEGEAFFEVEELYVVPSCRCMGIGQTLFRFMESCLSGEAGTILLSTATKNHRAILHFYIDELDMRFWSARLFKRLVTEA